MGLNFSGKTLGSRARHSFDVQTESSIPKIQYAIRRIVLRSREQQSGTAKMLTKNQFPHAVRSKCLCLLIPMLMFGSLSGFASSIVWTNLLGGSWYGATNWSPNAVPNSFDTVFITNSGAYTVMITNSANITAFTLGGGGGAPTLVVDNIATLVITNSGTIASGGIMIASNCWMQGTLNVQAGGELKFAGSGSKYIYSLNVINQGTVTWSGGSIALGGTPTTTISNGGLWQITGNDSMNYGGGAAPTWTNSGTLRKSAGGLTSYFGGCNFINQPGGLVDVLTGTLQLNGFDTNVLAGSFTATSPGMLTITGATWTDAGATASGTGVIQFTANTLNLRTNIIPGLKLASGDIYITGTNTFQQAGIITNLTLDGAALRGTNRVDNGTITMNSGNLLGRLTVQTNGQLLLTSPGSKLLYTANIINQGTVTMASGGVNVGGTPSTTISNGGLWQINGDFTIGYGGGLTPIWTNTGVLRKTAGTGTSVIDADFFNQPGGLVDGLSGTLRFGFGSLSLFAGTFNATIPGIVEIGTGTWSDAGGVTTGTGTNRLNGGTFNFRTNTIPGLKLVSGNLYVTGTNTFQQAGAITNLTTDGATLLGTNRVSGTLTVNSGSIGGQVTVEPTGQLALATTAGKLLYSFTLINQGTVNWLGGSLNMGGTVVSNGGLWEITGNDAISFGGGVTPVWTNSGTLRKSAGTGISQVVGMNFYNQPSGIVQVDTGTLQISSTTTNTAGTLRLNGGTLNANGTLAFSGGIFDGAGSVGANALLGGTISPGLSGAGRMAFASGLNLSSNATLTLDGIGTLPGNYDQLSVTGAVALGTCRLQVTSLPVVAPGTTFMIITNDGSDAVSGTFYGLPENSVLFVSGQPFRLHYAGGSGNDVTLVRETIPVLNNNGGLTNGSWYFSGTGATSTVYMIQATTDLIGWTNIGTATATAGGSFNFIDTNAALFTSRFYRVAK
ncbi:MAG: hypothetical protein JWM68_1619 [Verrucomicrobiales bacterium]|nr:hypothetical protein [Verrucomicrobiales bacterium]